MKIKDLAPLIDHTLLKPETDSKAIMRLCEEAIEYKFHSVCVNPIWTNEAASLLLGKKIKVCTVIGFPLGANRLEVKVREAQLALEDGAEELDVVVSIGKLKDDNWFDVAEELKAIRDMAGKFCVKAIIETCLLNEAEKQMACKVLMDSGINYLKTSTGFNSSGADINDIKMFSKICAGKMKIKASGGISNYDTAYEMILAGADRIGTSKGVKIIKEQNDFKCYSEVSQQGNKR